MKTVAIVRVKKVVTPDQSVTVRRLGLDGVEFTALEDGAIYVPDRDVTIDRWGDVVARGVLVGGVA